MVAQNRTQKTSPTFGVTAANDAPQLRDDRKLREVKGKMTRPFNQDMIDFEKIDLDGNGVIDRDEWKHACREAITFLGFFALECVIRDRLKVE